MNHTPFTPKNSNSIHRTNSATSIPSDIDDYIYGDAGICPSER